MSNRLKQFIKRGLLRLIDRLPDDALPEAIARRCQRKAPADALRLLFRLDQSLYGLQGVYAVAYGDGLHPKHRLMRYHDFFVSRIRPQERVLDIGCGIGAVAHAVAERAGAHVVGIDLNAASITTARQQFAHPRVDYRVGDALQALPGEHFQVVILSNVLEHLPDRATFLRRVVETVTPDRLLIRVPLYERDWRVPLKQELGMEWRLDPDHQTEYTLQQFTDEMAAAGLRLVYQEVRWGEIWAELAPA